MCSEYFAKLVEQLTEAPGRLFRGGLALDIANQRAQALRIGVGKLNKQFAQRWFFGNQPRSPSLDGVESRGLRDRSSLPDIELRADGLVFGFGVREFFSDCVMVVVAGGGNGFLREAVKP